MASEQRSFVFAVSFILLFSTLLATIPVGLQGGGATGDNVTPVNPSLLTDFADSKTFNGTDFTPWFGLEIFEYNLASRDWICGTNGTAFDLNAKIYVFGALWLGQLDSVRFFSPSGVDRGLSITMTEIGNDAEDGSVLYNIIFSGTGNSAGGFVFYWNSTTYSNPLDAWGNDTLYLIHGVGLSVDTNIASLLISLLLLQLPDVPVLVSVLLVIPIWASIIFVLWFIIKEMIPFL